ncbi:PKD domain-containing protein [Petrachloros mirabilis]
MRTPQATEMKGARVKTILCFNLLVALWMIGLSPGQALAFKIKEPAHGQQLEPGKSITAHVDLGNDIGIVKVRYYWYGELDETLVEQDDFAPAGELTAPLAFVGLPHTDPAFGGPLLVPKEGIGPMRLLAVAEISQGRLGTRSVFDEIIVNVEPRVVLTRIDFETEKPLLLGRTGQSSSFGEADSMGKIFALPVVADFADGVTRNISSPSTGTTYQSSNPKVIKVLTGGMLQITGNGNAVITVSNRGKQAQLDVEVSMDDEEPNEPPIADAGANQTMKAGSKVKLNGLKSRDPEGEALFYAWSQIRGSKISLLGVNNSEASFLAPRVSTPKLFRFKLRVTDKKGADSLPAFVDVTVEP